MNILVTGVNGLVGKAIAEELLKNNILIGCSRALVNKTNLLIDYECVDISDSNSFNVLKNKQIDVVIHCAASLDSNLLSEDLILSNCLGIRNIANFVIENKCKQFIYISSISIIGKPIQIPIKEDHQVKPPTAYHTTKYFGELYLTNVLKNCSLAILRIPSPIGRDLSENKILPVFIKKCISNEDIILSGNGGRVQNYIDIKDVAIAVDLVIKNNISGIYNIAALKSFSNKELAEICIKVFNSNSRILYTGIDSEEENKWIISIEKAKKDFKFNPSISLETSIKEISKRYLS